MKKTINILITALLIAATGCGEKSQKNENYDWILGTWTANDDDGVFHEKWEKGEDGNYHGEAWIVVGGDVVFGEQLTLGFNEDTLYYIAELKDNYNARFTTTSQKENEFEVKLPENNFPSTIKYKSISADEIEVTLSGVEDGEDVTQVIGFKRASP